MSINKVIISGNVTRDPEMRQTANGLSILSFGVAVNDRKKNADGSWGDYANFVDCTVIGRRADALQQYIHKGTKVAIEGKLHYSSWESNGQKRSKLDVTVDEIEFMNRGQSQGQPAYQDAYADAEIPF